MQDRAGIVRRDADANDELRSTLRNRLQSEGGTSNLLLLGQWQSARISIEQFWHWQDEYDLLYSSRVILTDHPAVRANAVGGVVLFRPIAFDALVRDKTTFSVGSASIGHVNRAKESD
jgi:hypothetical protein